MFGQSYSLAQAEDWFEWVFVISCSNMSHNRAISELRVTDFLYFMYLLSHY